MPDLFIRVSPLSDIAIQGRFGADHGVPGVMFSLPAPSHMVTVIARKGKAKALAQALKNFDARWAGPDQYFVWGEPYETVSGKLKGLASCSDQSHGRVVIGIVGPHVRQVLAKGSPIDFHPAEFPVGKSALTQMAHVGVHVTRVGADAFEISVFRGFSESFWEWITEQAEEFGYQVT